MLNQSLIAVSLLLPSVQTTAIGETKDTALGEVKQFEKLILKWVESIGTGRENDAFKLVDKQRSQVVKVGKPAIKHLIPLLKHKQVNMRRGTAIALFFIIENHKVEDRKLLDTVLLRMIEDDDIRVRSNLYHVANALIKNLIPTKKSLRENSPGR